MNTSCTDFLVNTRLLQDGKKAGQYRLFGELFNEYVEQKVLREELTYDEEKQQIFYGMTRCDDRFTPQEMRVLAYLLTHDGVVLSRDQMAEAMWGRNANEKYSDWAIDKLISTIRGKLDALGFPSERLVTLKGRGFRFSN